MRLAFWLIVPSIAAGQSFFSAVEAQIQDFTLSNGMTFVVCERNLAPVAAFRILANVGATQDPPHATGLAHMFEHMAFKGTSTLGSTNYNSEKIALDHVDETFQLLKSEREKGALADQKKLAELELAFTKAQEAADAFVSSSSYAQAIDDAGGRDRNAATSYDTTDFYYELPVNAIELWFLLESQRFSDPVFREFYKERSVVLQERRVRLDGNPTGMMMQETLKTAFRLHPYGHPLIGEVADLQNLTRNDAKKFFERYYQPSNLTAVIVGHTNVATVKQLAEMYFGRIPSKPRPAEITVVEPPQTEERSSTVNAAGQSMLSMAFHRPNLRDSDAPVYEILAALLTEGRSARLKKALTDTGMISGLRSQVEYPGGKYPNLLLFSFTPLPGHSNDSIVDVVIRTFEAIKENGVTEEEVNGAKARFRAAFLYQLKDDSVFAAQLALWQVTTGSWRNLFRYLEGVAAVKPEDVRRLAQKVLNRNNLTITKLEPLQADTTKQ